MLEQVALVATIVAAIVGVLALYKGVTRNKAQNNRQKANIKGNGNSVKQDAKNNIGEE
jgi:hypothetical protein